MVERILDVFSSANNYDIALMTTFNFDVSFFEKTILNRLYENNIKKVSLFVDSYELNKALSEVNYTSIGKKYIVNPIEMRESFHPKLILLLGHMSAKLVVSSANITISGYLKNGEIFNVFDYDEKHPENLKIITSAIEFFEKLNCRSFNHDTELFEEIKELVYYNKTSENDKLYLFHNLEKTILAQIEEIIDEVIQIDVAVPYYDNYANALKTLHECYPKAKINLYLQHKKSKFPLEHKNDNYITSIFVFDSCNDSSAFYHGKVLRFISTDSTYILYGSANCTASALIKTAKENGNVECNVMEKSNDDSFNVFFDNFNIIGNNETLQCDLLSFEKVVESNFFYRYGFLQKELILNIGFTKKINLIEVCYFDIKLEYEYSGESLVISIPIDGLMNTDLIEIDIKYEDKQEKIKCWYTDIATVKFNRIKTSDTKLPIAIPSFEENEKYTEEYMTIIEALSLCYEDALKETELRNRFNTSTEDPVEDVSDDGVISFVIPEASELKEYEKYRHVDKHFKIPCFRFFDELLKTHITENKHIDADTVWYKRDVCERESSNSEYRFKNFVKSRVRQMLNPEFISYVSLDHYLFCVNTILTVFDKYSLKEYVKDMFDYEYLIRTRLSFMDAILSKDLPQNGSEEIKSTYFILICQMILESNKQVYKCEMDESEMIYRHRTILKELNKRFGFRDFMSDYVGAAIDRINEIYYLYSSYAEANKLMDEIFGYAKKEDLVQIIIEDYGIGTVVSIGEKTTSIYAKTQSIKDFMIPRERTIFELKKYFYNCGESQFIKIEVENIADVPANSGYAHIVCDEINLKSLTRVQRIIRKNGVVSNPTRTKML